MLRFSTLGIPVEVHATFLFVALLGIQAFPGVEVAYWTAAAFAAILLHELGHALTARAFGAVGVRITLFALGGLTSYRHGTEMSHGRSFLVSAAGSGVGILAGGVLWALLGLGVFDDVPRVIYVFVVSFIYAAMVWGLLNWVPIVPLDGGHMVLHFVSIFSEERAPLIAQVITWISVAIIVPLAAMNGYLIAAFLVVMFALTGLREFRRSAAPEVAVPDESASSQPEHEGVDGEGDAGGSAPSHSEEKPEPPAFPI